MKIETLHIAVESDYLEEMHALNVSRHMQNPLLLCGKRYRDYEMRTNSWATVEELIIEPLLEEENSKEVMCEVCKNHPDFILGYLAYV